jgi:hypothetical protein
LKLAKLFLVLPVAYAIVMAAYRATPLSQPEHDTVNDAHPVGLGIRVLTGFPPRYFLRLDPQ